jgi:prepilin-type processing-associated H-X9-DG protein
MIELLAVAAILLIGGFLVLRSLGGTSDAQRKKKAECELNLQKIHIALQVFANAHAGCYPSNAAAVTSEDVLDLLVPKYTVDTSVFVCPASQDRPLASAESLKGQKISYAYYMGQRQSDASGLLMSDRQIDTKPRPAGQYAFSTTGKPPGNNHKKFGGNFLFCDGHVQSTAASVPFALDIPGGIVLLNPKP